MINNRVPTFTGEGPVVAAESDEHQHGHWGVLLPVDLYAPRQVVDEGAEPAPVVVDGHHMLEHFGGEILAAEGERGGATVDRLGADNLPGGFHEAAGCLGDALQDDSQVRGSDALDVAEEFFDTGRVGAGIGHAPHVQLEVADEAVPVLVALLDQADLVDQPAGCRVADRDPRSTDTGQRLLEDFIKDMKSTRRRRGAP
ncbi:hypothetical protein OG332_36430 [Streptomyces sp. NBC_01233]|nr:hypothetical protein OG332_36430 [Streptomyces sp. NBC_01233]